MIFDWKWILVLSLVFWVIASKSVFDVSKKKKQWVWKYPRSVWWMPCDESDKMTDEWKIVSSWGSLEHRLMDLVKLQLVEPPICRYLPPFCK